MARGSSLLRNNMAQTFCENMPDSPAFLTGIVYTIIGNEPISVLIGLEKRAATTGRFRASLGTKTLGQLQSMLRNYPAKRKNSFETDPSYRRRDAPRREVAH